MKRRHELSDEQWSQIELYVPGRRRPGTPARTIACS